MDSNEHFQASAQPYGPDHAVGHPEGGVFWVRPARDDEIEDIHSLIASEISEGVGPASSMRAVFAKNPVAFWRIERRTAEGDVVPVGMYGFLPLTADGVAALKSTSLDRREPKLEFIAAAGTRPAALYVWAVVARKIRKLAYPLIKQALGPVYTGVPVYAVPATPGGLKAMADRGYQPLAGGQNSEGALAVLPIINKPAADKTLRVVVASSAEHLQMAAFIRGATFGAEQSCPYSEEFDGNDFCAMHLIGFAGDEPAATLRIRFFATFAKLERLAVLERYRRTPLKNLVMEGAIEICRKKGYTRLYGQSQERLVGFYARFGFRPLKKNRGLVFSDHTYVEIVSDLEPHAEPIRVDSDPYLIIRPEGRWDSEGVLERSSIRPATNPVRARGSSTASVGRP